MEHTSQKEIWSHYQNAAAGTFALSAPRLNYILKLALRRSPNQRPGSLLNIGAGNGFLEKSALKQGFQTSSLDLSVETVAHLKSLGIQAKVGTITEMPFEDGVFDVVVASEVLEHLSKEEMGLALSEIKRVLKPQGIFIGTVPFEELLSDNEVFCPHCKAQFHRWGHQQTFSVVSLNQVLSSQLRVESIYSRSFVNWNWGSLKQIIKSSIRSLLGRFGVKIAHPNIVFVCRR